MNALSGHSRALFISIAVVVAALVAWAAGLFSSTGPLSPDAARATDLEPFDSCDEILGYARENRWALDPYGYGGDVIAVDAGAEVLRSAELPVEDAGAAPEAAGPESVGTSETGTNVQEIGIDEPDIAKLSGNLLFVGRRDGLEVHDVSGDEPVLLSEIPLEGRSDLDPELLVVGDRVLVLESFSRRPDYLQMTRLTEIDASDPSAPEVLRTSEIEGAYVSARLTGEVARLVVTSRPQYPGVSPDTPGVEDGAIDDVAESTTEEIPSGATGETGPNPEPEEPSDLEPDWLPQITTTDATTGESDSSALFGCDAVAYPQKFAGLGMVSVLTLDAGSGSEPADVDTVLTDGSTVYASASSLYVATPTLRDPRGGAVEALGRVIGPDIAPPQPFPGETTIHRFATGEEPETSYAASGEVEGRILNEWSLSEHEGMLRVATTAGDSWDEGENESEAMVTVLGEEDGVLREVGKVGGMGRGEQIFGVRFIGDMGYVITFEQTDPLYTVDLSDPTQPETAGELEIPGYSAYLHPTNDGQLLGIGQSGTESGTLTGAQASLFDVSDASAPERTDTLDLAGGRYGSAAAEWDHHAFLYSPERSLAIVPVDSYDRFRGAVAVRVSSDGALTEVARIDTGQGPIRRSFLTDDQLVTVSSNGVATAPTSGLEN